VATNIAENGHNRDDDPGRVAEPMPERAEGDRELAVHAYCLELCGPELTPIATEEVAASPRLSDHWSVVPEPELLERTRSTASGFAPLMLQPGQNQIRAEGLVAECSFTLPRLARRANGELDRLSDAALQEHLAWCPVCRAAEARMARAERAFAAVLGPVLAPEEAAPMVEVLPPAPEEAAPMVEEEPPEVEELPVVEEEPPILEEEPPILEEEPPILEEEPPELEQRPTPERDAITVIAPAAPRGLVLMPAIAQPAEQPAFTGPFLSVQRRPARLWDWRVLMATLLIGAVVIAIIAVLWSSGSSAPNPKSLPPASATPAAAILGASAHRASARLSIPGRTSRLLAATSKRSSGSTSSKAGVAGAGTPGSAISSSRAGSTGSDSSNGSHNSAGSNGADGSNGSTSYARSGSGSGSSGTPSGG
jgi:hypothetical protein